MSSSKIRLLISTDFQKQSYVFILVLAVILFLIVPIFMLENLGFKLLDNTVPIL